MFFFFETGYLNARYVTSATGVSVITITKDDVILATVHGMATYPGRTLLSPNVSWDCLEPT